MFSAGSIQATMGLDARGFFSAMSGVESVGRLFPSFVQSFLGNPLLGLADVVKGTGKSLVGMVTGFIDGAASADRMARSVGQSVEFMSQLGWVVGSGNEGMATATKLMREFSKSVGEAANNGGEKAQMFRNLGISMGEVKLAAGAAGGANPITTMLRDLAMNLATLPDGAAGLSAVQKQLGLLSEMLKGVKGGDGLRQQIEAMAEDVGESGRGISESCGLAG